MAPLYLVEPFCVKRQKKRRGPPTPTEFNFLTPKGEMCARWEAGQAHTKPPGVREAHESAAESAAKPKNKPEGEPPPADLNVLRGGRGEQHPRVPRHTGKAGGGPAREKPAGPHRHEPQGGRRGERRNRARGRRLADNATKTGNCRRGCKPSNQENAPRLPRARQGEAPQYKGQLKQADKAAQLQLSRQAGREATRAQRAERNAAEGRYNSGPRSGPPRSRVIGVCNASGFGVLQYLEVESNPRKRDRWVLRLVESLEFQTWAFLLLALLVALARG